MDSTIGNSIITDSFVDSVEILSCGRKMCELLRGTALQETLMPDLDKIDSQLLGHVEFTEWFCNSMSVLDVITEDEIGAYKLMENIPEETVDKFLEEKLGNQEHKISLRYESVERIKEREEASKNKLSSIEKASTQMRCDLDNYKKNKTCLDEANDRVNQGIQRTLSSITNILEEIPELSGLLVQLSNQYLLGNHNGLTEVNSQASFKYNTTENSIKMLAELQSQFIKAMCKSSRRLSQEITVAKKLAFLTSLPSLEFIDTEGLLNKKAEISKLCEHMKQFELFQMFLKRLFEKQVGNKYIVSKLFENLNMDKIINEVTKSHLEELEPFQRSTENQSEMTKRLLKWNHALTDQNTLLTVDSFVSTLTNFTFELEKEENKFVQHLANVIEQFKTLISKFNNLLGFLDKKTELMIEDLSKTIQSREKLLESHTFIENCAHVTDDSGGCSKELKEIMYHCVEDYQHANSIIQQIKKQIDLLQKALQV